MKQINKSGYFIALLLITMGFISCGDSSKSTIQPDYVAASRTKDGRIGLIDPNGQWAVENAFSPNSQIICTDGVVTEIVNNGLTGSSVRYYVVKDKVVTPLLEKRFTGGSPFFDGFAIVTDAEGKLKIINKKGEETDIQNIEGYQIIRAGIVSEGLLRAKTSTGKWGYLNTKGEWVIRPKYLLAETFVGGVARVKDSLGMLHVINTQDKVLFQGTEKAYYAPAINQNIIGFPPQTDQSTLVELISFGGNKKVLPTKTYMTYLTPKGNVVQMSEEVKYGMLDTLGNIIGELYTRFESAPVELENGFVGDDKSSLLFFDSKGKYINTVPGLTSPSRFQKNVLAKLKDQPTEYQLISDQGTQLGTGSFFITYANLIGDFHDFKKGFTVQSTWMDFDKVLQEALKGFSPNGIQGLSRNTSVQSAVDILSGLSSASNNDPIDAYDNYSKTIYCGLSEPNPYDEEYVDYEPAASDTTKVAKEVNDPYSNISEYTYSHSSWYINGSHASYTVTAGFDAFLKIEKYGYEVDPVFKTEYYTFQGYQLNPDAKLKYVELYVNVLTSTTERFQEKMAEYLKKQGWTLYKMGGFRHPSTGNEVEFTPSGIKYIFP